MRSSSRGSSGACHGTWDASWDCVTRAREPRITEFRCNRVSGHYGVSVDAPGMAETWKRIVVVPGVELHLRGDLPRPREMEELLVKLETALRKGLG